MPDREPFKSHPPPRYISTVVSSTPSRMSVVTSGKTEEGNKKLSLARRRRKHPNDPGKSSPGLSRVRRREDGSAIDCWFGPRHSDKGSAKSTRSSGPSMAPVPENPGPEPAQDGEAADMAQGSVEKGDDDGEEEADQTEGEAEEGNPLPEDHPADAPADPPAKSRDPSKATSKAPSLKEPSRPAPQAPSRDPSNHPSRLPSRAPSSRSKDPTQVAREPSRSKSKGSRAPSRLSARHDTAAPGGESIVDAEPRATSRQESKARSARSEGQAAYDGQFTEFDQTPGTAGGEFYSRPGDNDPLGEFDGDGFEEQEVATTVKKAKKAKKGEKGEKGKKGEDGTKKKKKKGTKKAKEDTDDPPPGGPPQPEEPDYNGVEVIHDDSDWVVEREVERTDWQPTRTASHGRHGERSDRTTSGSRPIISTSRQSSVHGSRTRFDGEYEGLPPTPEYTKGPYEEGPPRGLSTHSTRYRLSDPRSTSARPPDIQLTSPSPRGSKTRQQSLAPPNPYGYDSGTGDFQHRAARESSAHSHHSRVSFAADPRADSRQEPQHRPPGASTSSRYREPVPGSFPEPVPSAQVHPADVRSASTSRHRATGNPYMQERNDDARSASRHSGYSQTQSREASGMSQDPRRQYAPPQPRQHDVRRDDERSEGGFNRHGGGDRDDGDYHQPSQFAHDRGSRHRSTAPYTASEIHRGFRHVTPPPTAGRRDPSHAASERVPSQQPPILSTHPRSASAATHEQRDSFVDWRMYHKENPNGGHGDSGPAQSGRAPSQGNHSSDHNDEYYGQVRSGSRYSSNKNDVRGSRTRRDLRTVRAMNQRRGQGLTGLDRYSQRA